MMPVMIQVAYGFRVPNASEATGNSPSGTTQLTTRIQVSARMAKSSSSNPLEVTSGRPVAM